MSKIYRLHSGAREGLHDWTQIDNYLDSAAINQIQDSAGAQAAKQVTSIPSPFAGIDLVKTAFKNVVAGGSPEGITIFHKMVSDALDVGQVFFNAHRLSNKVDIIPWNPGLSWIGDNMVVTEESDLDQLLKSDSSGHRLLGETLKMFFEQDAREYNFRDMQQFYLLNYKEGPDQLNIIGGTSPATLFCSSANDLQYVDIKFKNDRLFDKTYCPLTERSEDYILFMYTLRMEIPGFGTRFKAIDDYLVLCQKTLSVETRKKVQALEKGKYTQTYDSIPLQGEGNHPEIVGFELRAVKIQADKPRESDFVIAATQPVQGLPPLVLPAYAFNGPLHYVDGKWSSQVKVPFFDERPLAERVLPGQEFRYPYLTTSDFLEPWLIQLPFEPNRDRFFTGHLPTGQQEGYLLPLTQAFFTYFSSTDLLKPQTDGRPMFTFEKLPGNAVKAKLRIPVKHGRFIDMERTYTPDVIQGQAEPDLANNRGLIKSQKFSLAIYPFLKRGTDAQANYTVMLLDQEAAYGTAPAHTLKYYKDSAPATEIKPKAQRQKSFKQQHAIDTVFDIVTAEFDFIIVQAGKSKGCLLPLFPMKKNGNKQYSFAVDFGTTNTHIEYSVDGGTPQAFDVGQEDMQLGTLHSWDNETYTNLTAGKYGKGATMLLENVPKEMMPDIIGGNTKYKFPRRTVVSEPLDIDLNKDTYPFADFSIYWQYDIGLSARQLQAHTNLKWGNLSNGQDMSKRIEGYIGNTIQLIRNKVALNGGDMARTKIIWFYPTSMLRGRLQRLEKIWTEQVELYLGPKIDITHLPESVAPFYAFRNQHGITGGNEPVINIDIGGGTTDVVVYRNQSITSYTSFKFAGNALFGDAYNMPVSANGFVQFFERYCRDVLNSTRLSQFLPAKDSVTQSEEFITSLFGLQHHPDRGEVSFSFTEKLYETEELKIVPLIFISSLLYHIAQYQKFRNERIPRFITFSGTASKMLQMLDVSKGLKSISRLANEIFNDVFGVTDARLSLHAAEGPKEVTAKGGLFNPAVPEDDKCILFGTEAITGSKVLTYGDAQQENIRNAVLKEVEIFIDKFFSWSSRLDFTNEFSLNSKRFASFKKILKADLDIFLVEGIHELKGEMTKEEDSTMSETLFFMPLKGALNKLAFCIVDSNQA